MQRHGALAEDKQYFHFSVYHEELHPTANDDTYAHIQ